jgi:type 1 glutamine amidotransferase
MCRLLNSVIAVVFALATQAAVAADKVPDNLPNGERPWPAVAETDVQKIRAALPDKPPVAPQKPRKLLVFYRTDGYPHTSIPVWNKMLELLGEKTGAYRPTFSQSYADLQPGRPKEFDALFFNNTCGMATPEPVKAALQDFVKGGKGFAGNHGAGDNWHGWPEGLAMVGAEFVSHPFGRIQLKIDDPQSPLTAVFAGKAYPFRDEIYAFKAPYSREKLHMLLSIDYPNSPEVWKAEKWMRDHGPQATAPIRTDHDYAVSWIRPWGQGRVFYCSLGHVHEATWEPTIVRFFLAGIQYACGDLKADDAPPAASK